MAELADALALGASAYACRFKSCHPHQIKRNEPFRFVSLNFLSRFKQDLNLRRSEALRKQFGELFLARSVQAGTERISVGSPSVKYAVRSRRRRSNPSFSATKETLFVLFLFFFTF